MIESKLPAWVLALIVVLGVVPVVVYWVAVGRAPGVTAAVAAHRLSDGGAVLVDVRPRAEFDGGHVEAAYSWPLGEILAATSSADLPPRLQGRTLLLICTSGMRSARATLWLREIGVKDVLNVRGGLMEWTAASRGCPLALARTVEPGGTTRPLPFRESSGLEQWAVTIAAFGIKPIYMLLSAVLIVVLWRMTAPDLASLRRGQIGFLSGELFCAANFLIFGEGSYLVEYLHSFGMVVAFAFSFLAIAEALDSRVLRVSDPSARCALTTLCTDCTRVTNHRSCAVRRLTLWLLPLLAVLALMPLCAELGFVSYNTTILGTPYNHNHPVPFQLFEVRYAPTAALLLLGAAALALWWRRRDLLAAAKYLAALGLGLLAFGFFRFVLYGVYRQNLAWYIVWEEVLELLWMLACAAVLWLFRKGLLMARLAAQRPT